MIFIYHTTINLQTWKCLKMWSFLYFRSFELFQSIWWTIRKVNSHFIKINTICYSQFGFLIFWFWICNLLINTIMLMYHMIIFLKHKSFGEHVFLCKPFLISSIYSLKMSVFLTFIYQYIIYSLIPSFWYTIYHFIF